MKNGKKIACLTLTAAMALSCMGAGTALAFTGTGSPVNAEATPPATTWANPDWNEGSGDPTATYDSETGWTHVEHMVYGATMTYAYKVKIDGLSVRFVMGKMGYRNATGFGFSDLASCTTEDHPWTKGNALAMSVWGRMYGSATTQTRMNIGSSHDYQATVGGSIVYSNPQLTGNPTFGPAASYVMNYPGQVDVTLTFAYEEADDVYSLTVTPNNEGVCWGNNLSKVYFDKKWVESVMDENGEAYFVAEGMAASQFDTANPAQGEDDVYVPESDAYYLLEDDNIRAYKAGALKTAEDTVEAYKTAIENVRDEQTFTASQTARETAVAGLESIRGNDKIILQAKIEEYDKLYTNDADVQTNVKAALQTSFTAATAAVDTLKGETEATAVTQENITAASTAIEAARTNYNGMKNMLTEANDEEFTGLLAGYDYDLAHAKAKLWVMGLEAQNAAIEAEEDPTEAATLIGAAEAYNDGYANSDAKTFIDTVTGHDTEKTAMQTRVTNAQNKLTELKTANGPAIKEFYLEPLETAVAKDLTSLNNITDAKGKLAELNDKVEIAEGDGELYTRFTAAYNTLKTAAETYVNGQIEEVNTALDKAYEEYTEYDAVRKNFNKISLTLLLEENATIRAAYDALKAKKEAQVLDPFNVTSQSKNVVLEQNYTGIYYENDGQHPSRLNYNKPLDLTAGVTINIELTQIWCTDCGDGENENRSNNFVFNFLGGPNEYKGNNEDNTPANSGGFSLYVWMFDGNCNVQILNPATDAALSVSSQLSTPAEGSVLTIEIKYADYIELDGTNRGKMWQILINDEAELNFTDQMLLDKGMTSLLDGEGKATGYFSVGTYANDQVKQKYPDGVNAFTIISIGDEEFAKPAPEVATATVTAGKTEATVGETVTFTSSFTPGEAVPASYEWYVNGQKQTVTNRNFAFKGETAGTYTVYCMIDGIKSNEVTVTFAASTSGDPGTTEPGNPDDPGTTEPGTTDPGAPAEEGGCGSAIGLGFGGALMAAFVAAAAGVVLFARKRKQD